jgi:hypothetical protein
MTDENKAKIEEHLRRDPLVKFSVYAHIQAEVLKTCAHQIRALLDIALAKPGVVDQGSQEAYGLFWLWLLGACEVTRTMTQAKSCFHPAAADKLYKLKKRLSKLRMPFAKQEYEGQSKNPKPVRAEPSICGFDHVTKSMEFEVDKEVFSVREVLDEFEMELKSITFDDILAGRRDSERYRVAKQRETAANN